MSTKLDKSQSGIIEFFFSNKDVLKNISKSEIDDLCVFIFEFINQDLDSDTISKMITILYRICYVNDITLEEVWEIYWNIKYLVFSRSDIKIIDGDLRELYTYIFTSLSKVLPCEHQYREVEKRDKKTIVITTSQMLGIGHAPTIRVLDYAYSLQHDLNKRVVIVNDCGMNFIVNKNINGQIKFNYDSDWEGIRKIEHKGEVFEYVQTNTKMPNINSLLELADIIYEINPLLVYNIGGESLLSDYCTYFTTTASLPCALEIPISCSKYLLLGRKLNLADSDVNEQLLDYQFVIETNYNYKYLKNNTTYTREEFNISEDAFLICIVGNRLDVEVTSQFLEVLNKIQKQQKAEIVFIGNINNKERIEAYISNKGGLHFTGSVNNAGELIKHCDLYLNPIRSGGGRSSFEALYYGIPVITPKVGDVYYICGDEFSVKDNQEIVEEVKRYMTDREYYKCMSNAAIKRAKVLGNIKETLQDAIEKIMINE